MACGAGRGREGSAVEARGRENGVRVERCVEGVSKCGVLDWIGVRVLGDSMVYGGAGAGGKAVGALDVVDGEYGEGDEKH